MKNSSFIRDLLVKVLLIVIFIFLLMYLFPMPNLTPFYSSIFNNNIQTMKDAAEDYYTIERMPKDVGKSSKMTLQDMIDKKLIIPFVDKDGNSCDTNKSYVKVTKGATEYELKVSLTCGKDSNYIIEKIGCYNFCPNNNCTLKELEENNNKANVPTKTDKDGNVTVVPPSDNYVLEYEYRKNLSKETWNLGDWTTNKQRETNDVKLVDTRTLYTGQKKVTSGTKLYEQISYGYNENYTYDTEWSNTTKTCDNCTLWKERTLYTGQKRIVNTKTEYKHEKYGVKDNWTYDENWTTEVKPTSDKLKLWKERTLYTGQKKLSKGTTEYKHVKYGYNYTWNKTEWTTTKRNESDDIKLVDTRYTVRKTTNTTTSSCDNWTLDPVWYSSKPADTNDRVYADAPANTQNNSNWRVVKDSFRSYDKLSTYEGDYWYEFLYTKSENCVTACNGKAEKTVYYYRVYQRSGSTTYQYKYCTPKTSTTSSSDEKLISSSELSNYTNNGYTIVKTEYIYNVRTTEKYVADTKWTSSKTAPSGYEYTGKSATTTTVKYEQLDKWVTSESALGEYTYNVKKVKQYKYAYNNPTRYLVDVKWTTSKTAPSGYEYTGKSSTTTTVKYEQLDKWVTSVEALGEYSHNINTAKQYKYKYVNRTKYIKDTIWTTENVARSGYELTGKTKDTSKTTYIDLGRWVNSKNELGEYTYNIQTRTEYRYKYRTIDTETYIKWARTNPGNGYEPTGNSRKVYIQINRQK